MKVNDLLKIKDETFMFFTNIKPYFKVWSKMCKPYQLFPVPKYYFDNFFIITRYFQLKVGTHLHNDMMVRLEYMICIMFVEKIDFIQFSVFKRSKMCNPKFPYLKIEFRYFLLSLLIQCVFDIRTL